MTPNEKIMAAVEEALGGDGVGTRVGLNPGQCLKDVRLILERAFGWPDTELYRRHLTHRVETPSESSPLRWTRPPHARDMERSLRAQGMVINRAFMQPGDLCFNHAAAAYSPEKWAHDFPGEPFPATPVHIGHVGIFVGLGEMMLENINPYYRAYGFGRRSICLTPLSQYEHFQGPITTVIRFVPKEDA